MFILKEYFGALIRYQIAVFMQWMLNDTMILSIDHLAISQNIRTHGTLMSTVWQKSI